MREKTEKEKQRTILFRVIQEISKDNMDMYYSSHSDTASEVYEYIQNSKSLPREDQELVKDLKVDQISIILSLKS